MYKEEYNQFKIDHGVEPTFAWKKIPEGIRITRDIINLIKQIEELRSIAYDKDTSPEKFVELIKQICKLKNPNLNF